jgi:O-antigen ligase
MTESARQRLDNAVFFFFTLFIFSSTFSIALSQTALGLSLVLFLVTAVATRYNPFTPPLRRFYALIALYILWMLLAALLGETPLRSAWMLKEEWLFAVVPLGIFLFDRPDYRHKLVLSLGFGLVIISIYGIIQHFTGIHWFQTEPPKPAPDYGYQVNGYFSHSLTFGNYYGTAAAFLFGFVIGAKDKIRRSLRSLLIFASLLSMIATVLSYSRGPILGLVVILVLAGILVNRKYLVVSLGALVVVAVAVFIIMPGLAARFTQKTKVDFGGVYEGGRVFIWKNSIKVIREDPLFGVGQGNFKKHYTAYLRADIPEKRKLTHAHNDVLNVAAVAGIPGAVFFLGMWLAVFAYLWKGWRARDRLAWDGGFFLAALLGSLTFFITSLFEATFADEEVRQLLMFIWAAGLWQWYKKSKHDEKHLLKT